MHEIRASRTIEAPKSAIWEVLDDFGNVDNWDDSIESSSIVAGPDTGKGATRECILDTGDTIREQVVEYQPESTLTVEATDTGSLPVRQMLVEWSLRELGESQTEVTLAGRYDPKYGPVGWLMAKAMMNSKFEEAYADVLEALAGHVEQ